MSTAKKGAGIAFVIPTEAQIPVTPADTALPKSGVAMVALGGMASAGLKKEIESAKERLRVAEGQLDTYLRAGTPPVRLDARKIRASRWANRHESSFRTPEFVEFKEDLREAGGNLVPIKVRPVEPVDGIEYELVYGHRRHRGCLELGLPVLALVQQVDDKQLFADMDRENRNRASLSIYEQGAQYVRAVEAGLFKNYAAISAEIGVSLATVSKAVKIASLPPEVIECFSAPIAISYRMGAALGEVNDRDPTGLLSRASKVFRASPRPSDEQVLKLLLNDEPANKAEGLPLHVRGKKLGLAKLERKGGLQVAFKLPPMSEAKRRSAVERIQSLLDELTK